MRKLGKVRIWNVHSSSWEWCLEFKGFILIDNIMDTISQYHGLTSFGLIFYYFHKLLQIQTHHRQLHNERTMCIASSHRWPKLKTKRDLEVVALALRYNSTPNEKCSIKYLIRDVLVHVPNHLFSYFRDRYRPLSATHIHTKQQWNNDLCFSSISVKRQLISAGD